VFIRPERPADAAAIARVVERAFAAAPFSSRTEQFIVRALREAHALAVSLVAEQGTRVVGHVACSPVSISSGVRGWYGLGPVAVDPAHQGQGTGSALIRAALAQLRSAGAAGCVVLGEPAYYGRFGFHAISGLVYPGPPAEYFMAQGFDGSPACGEVAYHPAFDSSA
jgi:putative acetyltransferase